ncbi:MAG: 50S ribosomal protein L18 [Candidatus Cloacimonadaceae bacterium]|jgi:large subunit ribosomal protein L18|nr:50S ribosomal protein L18 [Candidatus Cloacimonadota bacterium]MDX9950386.1 50S ribosomal protein L18 [Candidatus Syntrophosphaera sp.]NLN85017.1 50S ribosomal protein L18 [Candidatus Cloacimonadota bacterium]
MIKPSNIVKNTLRVRRRRAIRNRLNGTTERPRLVVFRSLKHIYAQIIDDTTGKTLVSASSRGKDVEIPKGIKKTEQGFQVGQKLGEKAIAAGLSKVAFDRAGYKYHGRVKALAEGARKAGLDF